MKKIDIDKLPKILTPELISIIVEIASEFPKKTDDWQKISNVLSERNQLNIILDIVEKHQDEERKKKWDSLSKEQQEIELKRREESIKSNKFSGNMGEPEAELGKDTKPKLP
jgi:hypothetical protein